MSNPYVTRTLIANSGQRDERIVADSEIPQINTPIVILGDPGSGKTKLTQMLERQFGYTRVAAGTFYRNQDTARFQLGPDTKLIIDGLDEITSSSGGSAIDEVLKKLSQIRYPKFILSCRSADWNGSADRYKIHQDYGVEPTILHLQPFTYEDAETFLNSYDQSIDADYVLDELHKQDLTEFYVNPLTLTLIAEIVAAGQGLPTGRIDLLDRASELLTSEKNPAHQHSPAALANLDALLESAGAIFSHLLLSGSTGLADRPRDQVPEGYVHHSELNEVADAPAIPAAMKTRLFQSPDENLYIPFHRVIAEYLGARWLSRRMSNGLSERRVFQALSFVGGVPTAFRGMHAWLAHFSPSVAPRCIQTDPYGVLRYGDTDQLPLHQAGLLLSSLAALADEDPYFRNEDWGKRAISGLARTELKDKLVELIKNPDRHVHLSTLILEALRGSPITNEIAQELLAIVQDSDAFPVERSHAAEALVQSHINTNWPTVVETLRSKGKSGDKRLALEIIAFVCGDKFSGVQIANAIIDYEKRLSDDDEDDDGPFVSGMTYGITQKISPKLSREILDGIVENYRRSETPADWRPGYELANTIRQLMERAIEGNDVPSPERVWSWLKLTDVETGYSSDRNQPVRDWLLLNSDLRRRIQKLAIETYSGRNGPWIVIVHDLPIANGGLALSADDTAEFLIQIGSKNELSEFDLLLWADLVRSQQSVDGISKEIKPAVSFSLERHAALRPGWEELIAPPKRDYRREENDRKVLREQRRAQKYAEHRTSYWPLRNDIASGKNAGSLIQLAVAYLGRYSDLDRDTSPRVRIQEWLGEELTSAALEGFVSTLSRDDIPSALKMVETRIQGKYLNIELVLICGIAELVNLGRPLTSIPRNTAMSALAAWWENSDADRLGEGIRTQLEDVVLSSDQNIDEFLSYVAEPLIGAGHQHVPALSRVRDEDRFKSSSGRISIRWLRRYPNANASVQLDLLRIAVDKGSLPCVQNLLRDRLPDLPRSDIQIQRSWMSASFVADFEHSRKDIAQFFAADKDHLWILAGFIRRERDDKPAVDSISIEQREFIIRTFGGAWPLATHPSSSIGDTNPWNASAFIRASINAIAANSSEEASASLDRMASIDGLDQYLPSIKHARAQQIRLRRDAEFRVPTFEQIKQTLAGSLPGNIDDLRAVVMDRLEGVQNYLRTGDTNAWEAFWLNEKPKNENTCRDRLLDLLRPKLPVEINFLPEITMPEANRADIVAIYHGYGVPIEIKGQWHPNVWNAATVQLIEKYAIDWRADERGIYLVLWFGRVTGKNLPKPPEGLLRPSSSNELQELLLAELEITQRAKIDVFVLDVSKPPQ